MSSRERLTLAAALAVALGIASLVPLYSDLGWLLRALGAIAAVATAGLLARRLNLPGLLQPLLTTAALAAYCCVVFARSTLSIGFLPNSRTYAALRGLFEAGLTDIERLSPPVPTNAGLTLIAVLGVGTVAVAVDLVAVVMSRAAVAGLPLLVLFAVPSAVLPGGLGWIPFVVGAAGWLALLLVEGSDRVSRWGTPLKAARPDRSARYDDTSLGRVGRRIGAAALGVAVIVPALIPGLNTRLVGGGGGDGPGDGSRTTTTYNPITRLRDDLQLPKPRDILVYNTTATRPDYLRMTTLDQFSDAGWSSSKLSGNPKRNGVKDVLPAPVGVTTAEMDRVKVSVRIRTLDARWLPVPAVPSRVDVDGPWLYDERSETVFSIRTSTKKLKKSYQVTSLRAVPDRSVLAAGDPIGPPEDIRQYALNPGEQVTTAVRELTESVIKGRTTPYAKVAAIQAFFTNPASGFTYSLSPQVPGIDSPSALADFLQGRRGFCEQYSSAMGAMIRIAGVPARVAVGFTPGTRQKDGSYRVTTNDAHAWPEAWFAGIGWLRFEPTPRRDQVSVPGYATPLPGGPNGPGDLSGAEPEPSRGPNNADDATGNAKLDQLDRGQDPGGAVPKDPATAASSQRRSYWLAAMLAVAALLLLPRAAHVLRRRRRWRSANPPAGWQQVRDDAIDLGHLWRPADSPRAAAAYLAQRYAFDAPARETLDRLAAAAERDRYARDGAGELEARYDDAALVRSALRRASGRRTRWRAWLLPTSTLRWASSTTGTFVADALDRFDETWALVTARRRPGGVRPS